MGIFGKFVFLITTIVILTHTTSIFCYPTNPYEVLISSPYEQLGEDDDGGLPVYDGETEERYVWIPTYYNLLKRAAFWSPHPSDFSPMRRPGSTGSNNRNSIKKSVYNPYHPVPRSVNQNQRNADAKNENEEGGGEGQFEPVPEKRQSPGSFLLMKLGRIGTKGNGRGSQGRKRS